MKVVFEIEEEQLERIIQQDLKKSYYMQITLSPKDNNLINSLLEVLSYYMYKDDFDKWYHKVQKYRDIYSGDVLYCKLLELEE